MKDLGRTTDGHHIPDSVDGDTIMYSSVYNTEITIITTHCICDYVAHIHILPSIKFGLYSTVTAKTDIIRHGRLCW